MRPTSDVEGSAWWSLTQQMYQPIVMSRSAVAPVFLASDVSSAARRYPDVNTLPVLPALPALPAPPALPALPAPMIRLLAVDIDGTLLDSRGRLPDPHRDAL